MSLAALAILAALPARALDVDFDVALIILDDYLDLSGVTTNLAGQDNDANGIKEEDQLGMLSAILAGGSGVSCINASRIAEITAGFSANYTKVKQELVVNISGFGTVDIINQLAASNAQLGAALQNTLAGFLTIADTSTVAFVNQLSDALAAAVLTSLNQSGQISSVQNQINFNAADYDTFGNAPPGPNYLGPAGDIENDGASNLDEYTIGAVPKGRELWLADCCITAPLRIVSVTGGGLKVSGLSETFSVSVAGGNSNKTYSWRKGTSANSTVVSTSPIYTINFLATAASGNYFCIISDGTTTRTTPDLTLSVTYVPMYFAQQPQGATKQTGRSHTFSAVVQGGAGPGPYQYTWRKGTTTVGTNASTYTISSITAADAGTYTVRVTSNGGGDTITSQNAVLTVGSGTFSIIQQPASAKLYVGQAFDLVVVASGGSGNYQYTWTRNGATIGVTNVGTIGTASVAPENAGTYRVTVKDLNSGNQITSDNAVLEVAQALSLTQQPQGSTVSVGEEFAMSVTATGGFEPLTYQWQWEGLNIPGQNEALYQTIAYSGFGGDFTCVVTDANNQTVTSAPATLVVNATVEILIHPIGGDFYYGETTTLSVIASGASLTYTWLRDGAPFGAPNAASVSLVGLGNEDAGTYTVEVAAPGIAPAVSDPAVIRVRAMPSIATQPKGKTLYLDEDHTLSIAATGGYEPLTYQWRRNTVNIDDAIDPALLLEQVDAGDQGTYSCVVTDQRDTQLISSGAVVFVVPHLELTTQPVGGTAYVGDGFTLTAGVTGGAPTLSYAWRRNGSLFGAPNTPQLNIASATLADDGDYVCTITDGRGSSVATEPVNLDVEDVLAITQDPQPKSLYAGETLQLAVGVSGGFPPLTYIWRLGGVPLDVPSQPVLTIASITADKAGNYSCTVRDRLNRIVTSEAAAVSIAEELEVAISPESAKKYTGDDITMTATVLKGQGLFHYLWRKDGFDVGAADAPSLILVGLTQDVQGSFTCLVTSGTGAGAETPPCVLEVRDRPAIEVPPASDTVAAGTSAQFSVGVTGGYEPLVYEWLHGAQVIDDAGSAELHIESATANDAGQYRCRVIDALGTEVLSAIATLAVVPAMSVQTDVADTAAYLGNPASFTFSVVGGVSPVTYRWYKGEEFIAEGGAVSFEAVSADDAGVYRCVAEDADGNQLESAPGTLATGMPINITSQPGPVDLYVGEATTIAVEATGGIGPLFYSWTRNGNPVGDGTPQIDIQSAALADAGLYICIISDALSDVGTNAEAMLDVAMPLAVAAEVVSREVYAGSRVTASVSAAFGFPPYTYAWYRNDLLVSTDATLNIPSAALEDAGAYACIVSDKYTSAEPVDVLILAIAEGLPAQSADIDADGQFTLSELLRVIQFYSVGSYHCEVGTEDGFAPDEGDTSCMPHTTDYSPQDWQISLSELLRLIQFYSSGGYYACPDEGTEDGYCPGPAPEGEGSGQ